MSTHTTTASKIQEISSKNIFVCLYYLDNKKIMKDMHNCTVGNLRNLYQEIFKRFVKPFYIPSLILISLFLIMNTKENAKYNKFRFAIFIFGLMLIILSESTSGYINNNYYENLKFIIIPFLIFLSLYLNFFYHLKLKLNKYL